MDCKIHQSIHVPVNCISASKTTIHFSNCIAGIKVQALQLYNRREFVLIRTVYWKIFIYKNFRSVALKLRVWSCGLQKHCNWGFAVAQEQFLKLRNRGCGDASLKLQNCGRGRWSKLRMRTIANNTFILSISLHISLYFSFFSTSLSPPPHFFPLLLALISTPKYLRQYTELAPWKFVRN